VTGQALEFGVPKPPTAAVVARPTALVGDRDHPAGGLGIDGLLVAPLGEGRLADVENEVLGDLHLPGADPGLGLAGQP
jgi:hypothetical protein